jgi:hypothetical protein
VWVRPWIGRERSILPPRRARIQPQRRAGLQARRGRRRGAQDRCRRCRRERRRRGGASSPGRRIRRGGWRERDRAGARRRREGGATRGGPGRSAGRRARRRRGEELQLLRRPVPARSGRRRIRRRTGRSKPARPRRARADRAARGRPRSRRAPSKWQEARAPEARAQRPRLRTRIRPARTTERAKRAVPPGPHPSEYRARHREHRSLPRRAGAQGRGQWSWYSWIDGGRATRPWKRRPHLNRGITDPQSRRQVLTRCWSGLQSSLRAYWIPSVPTCVRQPSTPSLV